MVGVGMFGWLFEKPLPAGSIAPEFSLPDQDGNLVSLASFRGRFVILVFYPGDDTPVCRKQLCEFRDRWPLARQRNAAVLGVNPQNAASHAKFRELYTLPFPLLVDEGQKVARLYRAAGFVVRRTVYMIGADGKVRYSRRGKPSVDEILAGATVQGY